MVKRILSFFTAACLGILLLVPLAPSAAASGSYIGSTTYWDQFLLTIVHSTSGIPFLGQGVQSIAGALGGGVCSGSENALHHATALSDDKVYEDNTGMYSYGTCIYCGARFKVYSDDFADAYDDAVHELPGSSITSDGNFIWQTTWNDYYHGDSSSGKFELLVYNSSYTLSCDFVSSGDLSSELFTRISDTVIMYQQSESMYHKGVLTIGSNHMIAPISGIYSIDPDFVFNISRYIVGNGDNPEIKEKVFTASQMRPETVYYEAGDEITLPYRQISRLDNDNGYTSNHVFYLYAYQYIIEPASVTGELPSYDFRPGAGNYGVVGDDGQLTQLEDVTIVDEDSSTVYNPATNTTSNITDWTYDYSTRTYTVTLDTGETQTITYGDEYVVIQEGDTVYNVYYIMDGETEGPVETPGGGSEECQHEYTSEVTREPTCTFTGVTTYTCSLCGETYTESIPAIGHSWAVKETVQTSYDEDGNLLQQGYTIYKCSVCGEEYKDETGTGPPSGGGSGSEEGGGILDKLGQLIGTVLGGIVKVLEAVAGKLLDALIALVEMIAEKLGAVVELVLSFFDEIPQLFAGFLSFLGAVFPFFPEEVTLLLTFGIAVVVFIGIIKALRR